MIGWLGIVLKNLTRSPLRGAMTVAAVAVSLVAFMLLRSINTGWTAQVEQTPDNRVVTRHKMGWGGTLPVRYIEKISNFPGVRRASAATWALLELPQAKRRTFGSVAVGAANFVAMHYELAATDADRKAFIADRHGAFISEQLSELHGWKVGDVVHFRHSKIPGTVELTISGIYRSERAGFAERTLYFHWEYFNELLPEADRDVVNIIAGEVLDPSQGAQIATAIDIMFDAGEGQTFTQEDQALNAQIVGQFGAILTALNVVGYLILGIVLLVLGNTLAMVVRERTREYGAMRAVGFLRKQLLAMVVGEAALLGLAGGVLGLLLAFPLVEGAASTYLEQEMGFDPVRISLSSAVLVIAIGAALGAVAGIYPGYRLTRHRIVDALRRVA